GRLLCRRRSCGCKWDHEVIGGSTEVATTEHTGKPTRGSTPTDGVQPQWNGACLPNDPSLVLLQRAEEPSSIRARSEVGDAIERLSSLHREQDIDERNEASLLGHSPH